MARVLVPTTVLLGVVAVITGIFLQVSGAAAAVYCSVVGGGIVLLAVGAVTWTVHALRERAHKGQDSVGV